MCSSLCKWVGVPWVVLSAGHAFSQNFVAKFLKPFVNQCCARAATIGVSARFNQPASHVRCAMHTCLPLCLGRQSLILCLLGHRLGWGPC